MFNCNYWLHFLNNHKEHEHNVDQFIYSLNLCCINHIMACITILSSKSWKLVVQRSQIKSWKILNKSWLNFGIVQL